MAEIREVWRGNIFEELAALDAALHRYPIIAVDTEFPGCIRPTSRNANEFIRYNDMRYNVHSTDLIQLGLSLSDSTGCVCTTWEFNFSFDLEKDSYADDSVLFLKKNGIDFDKLKSHGVDRSSFAPKFLGLLNRHRNLTWVTFHGLYDMAYLYKVVRNQLPDSMQDFTLYLAQMFGRVVDLKHCAKFYKELQHGELGLEKLGRLLQVQRSGGAHHAGSDSLLTARAFHRMRSLCQMGSLQGFLYGLSAKISLPSCFNARTPRIINPYAFCNRQIPYYRLPPPPPIYVRTF